MKPDSGQLGVDNSFSHRQLSPLDSAIASTREQLTIVQVHKCHALCAVLEEVSSFTVFFWITL